ncbi:hypothetical protein ACFLS1_09215 [Verrucomicrobiota bacterium]
MKSSAKDRTLTLRRDLIPPYYMTAYFCREQRKYFAVFPYSHPVRVEWILSSSPYNLYAAYSGWVDKGGIRP